MNGSPRSLFIVALPRSLSTLVHRHAATALGLRAPRWTSAGEILNGGRLTMTGQTAGDGGPRFVRSGYAFEQLAEFLDDSVRPYGRAYKDVVQPFVMSSWLPGRELAVLRIRRPLAGVAFAMERAGWDYPQGAARSGGDARGRLLSGLEQADAALDSIAGEVVEFDDLLESTEPLRAALARLYPGREIPAIDYFDDGFRLRRRRLEEQRREPHWQELERRLAAAAA
jgi:hypothetical protein